MFVGLQRSVKRRMRDGPQTFQKSSHVTRFGCIRHIRVTVSLDNALHHNKEHSLGKVLHFHSAPSCSILTSLQDQFNCKQLNKACYKMYSSRSVSNRDSPLGRIDMGGKIKKVWFTYSDTLFPLYFLILRQVCFLALFDLRTPSFANLPIYIY